MKTNKTLLAVSVLLISIGAINTASAGWCGNNVFAAAQNGPNAGNLNCNSPANGNYANCVITHVVTAAGSCMQVASSTAAHSTNQADIANYTNLSWYFYGSYDYSGVRTSVVASKTPVTPAPNVNVVGACTSQPNGAICTAANAAVLNPNFVVPTVTIPASAMVTPPQTDAQCFTMAYTNANALYTQHIATLKAAQQQPHFNNMGNFLALTTIGADQQALQTNCNGKSQNVAGCTQSVKQACSSMQKSKYTYCNNSTSPTLPTNCQ